jgi:cell division protein FtsI (penicillin-binding protein 3)
VRSGFDDNRQRRSNAPEASSRASGIRAYLGGEDGRTLVLFGLFLVAVLIVVCRLVWYQVIQRDELTQKAHERRSNVMAVQARRGTIYDRNGNVLAMSEDCLTIVCNPSEINEPYLTAEVIAAHLGGETNDYVDSLSGDTTFAYVRRKVDTELANAIADELADKGLPGVYYQQDSRRVYPYGATGGQVLGIVGIDGDGLSGLELYYDDLLGGTNGEMILETGMNGTPIAGASATTTDAVDGTDIVISLDINIQRVAEENIVAGVKEYKAESG